MYSVNMHTPMPTDRIFVETDSPRRTPAEKLALRVYMYRALNAKATAIMSQLYTRYITVEGSKTNRKARPWSSDTLLVISYKTIPARTKKSSSISDCAT
jgi:Tat protein secretion system quality control protein TatD with DNase activity